MAGVEAAGKARLSPPVSTLIQPPGASQPPAADPVERHLGEAGAVRRVDQDEVAGAGRGADMLDALRDHLRALRRAEHLDVALELVQRGPVPFDEGAMRRAARQRLEAERAGAGEEIGDLETLEAADPADQHREEAFAGAGAGRAGGFAGRGEQARPRHWPAMIFIFGLPLPSGRGGVGRERSERSRLEAALRPASSRTDRSTHFACPPPLEGRGWTETFRNATRSCWRISSTAPAGRSPSAKGP